MTRAQLDAQIDAVLNDAIADNSLKPSAENGVHKAVADYVDQQDLLKADKTYVDTKDALKADKTYVDTQDALKANITYVNSQDALKADKTYVDQQIANITVNYKIFVAKISQVGTGTPTMTTLENNTGKTFIIIRNSAGYYRILPNVAFIDESKVIWRFNNIGIGNAVIYNSYLTVGNIDVKTEDNGGVVQDLADFTIVEIKIYS